MQRKLSKVLYVFLIFSLLISYITNFSYAENVELQEEYDGIIVENFQMNMNGMEVQDEQIINDGQPINFKFDWRLRNNEGKLTYTIPLDLKNIVITQKEGELYDTNNVLIGHYNIKGDSFILEFEEDIIRNESNIGGGAILEGIVNADADKKLPDMSRIPIGVNNLIRNVYLKNPGRIDFNKSYISNIYREGDRYYLDYKIIIAGTEIIKNAKICDEVDEKTKLDINSLKINNAEADITNQLSIEKDLKGFTISLLDSDNKKEQFNYEISYRVYLDSYNDVAETGNIVNNAKLIYNDDNNQEQTVNKSVKYNLSLPEIRKQGSFIVDGSGKPDPKKSDVYSGRVYSDRAGTSVELYPTIWKITVYPGEYSEFFKDSQNLKKMIFEDVIEGNNFLNDTYWLHLTNYQYKKLSNFYTGGSYAFQREYLSNSKVIEGEENTAKLFKIDYSKGLVGSQDMENVTLDDFEYDSVEDVYTYTYILYLPSYYMTGTYFKNTAKATFLDKEISSSAQLRYTKDLEDVFIKKPDGLDYYGVYNQNETSGAINYYQYIEDVEENESKDSINYSIRFNLADFIPSVNYPNYFRILKDITFEDVLGYYNVNNNVPEPYCTTTSSRSFNNYPTDFKDKLDISFYYADNDTQIDDLRKSSNDLKEYVERFGTKVQQKEGFSESDFDELYNRYKTAASKCGRFKVDNSQIQVFNNTIKFKITTSTSITGYFFGYNQNGEVYKSNSLQPLEQLLKGKYVMIWDYDAEIKDDLKDKKIEFFENAFKVSWTYKDEPYSNKLPTYSIVNTNLKINRNVTEDVDNITVYKKEGNPTFDNDEQLNYSTDTSMGWNVSVNIENAKEGKQVKLVDTLANGVNFNEIDDNNFTIYSTNNYKTNLEFNNTNLSDSKLNLNDFDININDNKMIITFNITDELKAKGKYINFYYKTDIDNEILKGKTEKISVTNKIKPEYDGIAMPEVTCTGNKQITSLIDKKAIDKNGNITGMPVIDKGNIYGYYKIELNQYGVDIKPESDTYEIEDFMTDVMDLDTSSIKAYEVDSNESINIEYEKNGNILKIKVPDNKHIIITYKVKFDVNPLKDVSWMRAENTNNSVKFSGEIVDSTHASAVNFARYNAMIYVWAYKTNGNISIFKYFQNDVIQTALPGAKFTLYTVYDNVNGWYSEDNKDYIVAENIEVPEDGVIKIDKLPLDRIYKLVETYTPKGYEIKANNEYYFVLKGDFNVSIPEELDGKVHEYSDGQIINYENKKAPKVTAYITKVDEKNKILNGAILQLIDRDGDVYKTWESNGVMEFVDIPVGLYTIHEVSAPEGYIPVEDMEIEIIDTDEVQSFTIVNRMIPVEEEKINEDKVEDEVEENSGNNDEKIIVTEKNESNEIHEEPEQVQTGDEILIALVIFGLAVIGYGVTFVVKK